MDNVGVGRFVDCTLSRRAVFDPSTVRPVWVGLGRDGSERNRETVTVVHRVHFKMKSTQATKRATVVTETTGIVTAL